MNFPDRPLATNDYSRTTYDMLGVRVNDAVGSVYWITSRVSRFRWKTLTIFELANIAE